MATPDSQAGQTAVAALSPADLRWVPDATHHNGRPCQLFSRVSRDKRQASKETERKDGQALPTFSSFSAMMCSKEQQESATQSSAIIPACFIWLSNSKNDCRLSQIFAVSRRREFPTTDTLPPPRCRPRTMVTPARSPDVSTTAFVRPWPRREASSVSADTLGSNLETKFEMVSVDSAVAAAGTTYDATVLPEGDDTMTAVEPGNACAMGARTSSIERKICNRAACKKRRRRQRERVDDTGHRECLCPLARSGRRRRRPLPLVEWGALRHR